MTSKKTTVVINGGTVDAGKAIGLDGLTPVKIQAQPNAKYLLKGDGGLGPENVTLTRVGNDLRLTLEGEASPALVVDGYFLQAKPAGLYGVAEDGQLYAYTRTDGGGEAFAAAPAGPIPVALGGAPLGAGASALAALDVGTQHVAAAQPQDAVPVAAAPHAPAPEPVVTEPVAPNPVAPHPVAQGGDGSYFMPLLLLGGLAAIGVAVTPHGNKAPEEASQQAQAMALAQAHAEAAAKPEVAADASASTAAAAAPEAATTAASAGQTGAESHNTPAVQVASADRVEGESKIAARSLAVGDLLMDGNADLVLPGGKAQAHVGDGTSVVVADAWAVGGTVQMVEATHGIHSNLAGAGELLVDDKVHVTIL